MAQSLLPCTGCQRHVRALERQCPFCGEALALREPIQELRLLTPLDRGRMMALGAVLATAGISLGCREASAPAPPPAPVAIYGAPAPPLSSAAPLSPAPAEPPPAVAPSAPTASAEPVAPAPTSKPTPPRPGPTVAPAYGGPPRMLTPEPNLPEKAPK